MTTSPITPARVTLDAAGVPMSPDYGDVYHPQAGALQQARHVFLAGNGLPARWQGGGHHTVLETGFGLGNNFLATWDAWRSDPLRCRQLFFVSIERHPLAAEDLRQLHHASPWPELASALCTAWPTLTPNVHRLVFEQGRVQLLLVLADVAAALRGLVAQVDSVYLDGYAPARNPAMWEPRVMKALGRLAAPDATVATWTAASAVREGLTSAGFSVREAAGTGGKRDITLALYAPAYLPKRHAARGVPTATTDGRVLVLGAGLAGCAASAALVEQGCTVTLVDRQPAPAMEASGNPAGLFHGVVHPQDGHHARFNRACALEATRTVRHYLADAAAASPVTEPSSPLLGSAEGLLRLAGAESSVVAMRAVLQRLGLPPAYVQALDAAEASAVAGVAVASSAWFYPGGGWVRPATLARAWLAHAGASCRYVGDAPVDHLRHDGREWQLLSETGAVIAQAPALVLANASGLPRLIDGLSSGSRVAAAPNWPLSRVRGQLSLLADVHGHGLTPPRVPVAGNGYVLPAVDGRLVFGATSQIDDEDPRVRAVDHRHNLERLAGLIPDWASTLASVTPDDLEGRTAWRCVGSDRLPLIGAVPDVWAGGVDGGWDQPRFVSRLPGLYLFTALGSRGITWAPLGAQVLASLVTGAPCPLESDLLDAVDPARFVARATRRLAADRQSAGAAAEVDAPMRRRPGSVDAPPGSRRA